MSEKLSKSIVVDYEEVIGEKEDSQILDNPKNGLLEGEVLRLRKQLSDGMTDDKALELDKRCVAEVRER